MHPASAIIAQENMTSLSEQCDEWSVSTCQRKSSVGIKIKFSVRFDFRR